MSGHCSGMGAGGAWAGMQPVARWAGPSLSGPEAGCPRRRQPTSRSGGTLLPGLRAGPLGSGSRGQGPWPPQLRHSVRFQIQHHPSFHPFSVCRLFTESGAGALRGEPPPGPPLPCGSALCLMPSVSLSGFSRVPAVCGMFLFSTPLAVGASAITVVLTGPHLGWG